MEELSIKTVDGNRYDFLVGEKNQIPMETVGDWVTMKQNGITRMFYKPNIVCITIKEADDA